MGDLVRATTGDMPAVPRCPICKRVVPAGEGARPFCSERCRLVDLGSWLDGKYRIGATTDDEDASPPASDADGPDDDPRRGDS